MPNPLLDLVYTFASKPAQTIINAMAIAGCIAGLWCLTFH